MFCSKIFIVWWGCDDDGKKGWQSDIRYTSRWKHETSINYKVFASCVKRFSTSVQVIYINCRDHIGQQLITSFVIQLRHSIPVILDITLNHCEYGVTSLMSADGTSTSRRITDRITHKQSVRTRGCCGIQNTEWPFQYNKAALPNSEYREYRKITEQKGSQFSSIIQQCSGH